MCTPVALLAVFFGTTKAIPRNMTGLGSVMKAGGYETHFSGKWDVGMATPTHTPRGRGYDASLHYFHHANDYWTYEVGSCPSPTNHSNKVGVVDLWEGVMGGGEGKYVYSTTLSPPFFVVLASVL